MKTKSDYIEVGGGKDSKVIGQNNSVSEYLTTVLSMLRYLKGFCFVAWVSVFFIAYYYGIAWQVSAILACAAMVATAVIVLYAMMRIFEALKSIQEPLPTRAANGRFQTSAPISRGGKKRGKVVKTTDITYVDVWGGDGVGG